MEDPPGAMLRYHHAVPRYVLQYGERRIRIPRRPFVVGRGGDCDLQLDDPLVSRHHLTLREVSGKVEAEDLGSRNGTTVNGRALYGRARLLDGDRILIGDHALVLEEIPRHLEETGDWEVPTMARGRPMSDASGGDGETELGQPDAVLIKEAQKAVERAEVDEAAGLLSVLARRIIAAGRLGLVVDAEDVSEVTRMLIWLAGKLSKWAWIDHAFEINAAQRQLLDGAVIDRLTELVEELSPSGSGSYSAYVALLQKRKKMFTVEEHVVLRRIESLGRLKDKHRGRG